MPPASFAAPCRLHGSFPLVFPEAEGFATGDVVAGERRTPVFLDVRDDEIVSGEVIDPGGALWIVHGIGHEQNQGDVLALLNHLPNPEGPAEDTHVEGDATEDDFFDAALGEEIPGFLAVVGDGIAFLDFDLGDLPGPRRNDLTLRLGTTAAHVGIVDRRRGCTREIPAVSNTRCDGLSLEIQLCSSSQTHGHRPLVGCRGQ